MFRGIAIRFIVGLVCLLAMAGCGSKGNSETSGQLNLTVTSQSPTGGLFTINAEASYSNADVPGSLQGFPIKVTFTARRLDGTIIRVVTRNLDANSAGVVNASLDVTQGNEVIIVNVVASSGGLSDQETIVVPSIAAMTSSPAVVAFPQDALAGSAQTVTISGGTAPYLAQIDAAHLSDISVTVNGNSIVLTKLKNSVTNGDAILATLTVSDSSGATPIAINVSYN